VFEMNQPPRKKSPRAPAIALAEAIERAQRIYDKESRHATSLDTVAAHIGYKDATSGAALTAIAALGYYGLVERPQESMMAVTKDFESFKFVPNEEVRRSFILKWLKSPALFQELLDKYEASLPSDATLKFDLIQRGFNPSKADSTVSVFRQSVDYARYYERQQLQQEYDEHDDAPLAANTKPVEHKPVSDLVSPRSVVAATADHDRIPVRLSGGRKAWLEIPSPFYEGDKQRLKSQIDLLMTDDELG